MYVKDQIISRAWPHDANGLATHCNERTAMHAVVVGVLTRSMLVAVTVGKQHNSCGSRMKEQNLLIIEFQLLG